MSHTQVLSTMRVGGRSHCIIPPNLGLCIEQGVRYEKPLPPDPSEVLVGVCDCVCVVLVTHLGLIHS